MPEPPAAFSALAMTRSMPSARRSTGTARSTKPMPGGPTMSPMNRIFMRWSQSPAWRCAGGSASELDRSRLAHDRHLDLARIVQLLLDGAGDLAADAEGV